MTKMGGSAESKLSLHSNTTVDIEAAIRLLQEVKKNASPEDLAALHEVLESGEDHAVPGSEQNLDRKTSLLNRSSSSLTRRRSLIQTPGMATRVSPVEGRRRTWNSWRAPKLPPEEEAKWKAAHKGPSPMARLSVVDSLDEDRGSSTARAQTPLDLDYGHLGGLRLGTLMVTNGTPSPAASTVWSDRTPRTAMEEDYFSASEAYSDSLMMNPTRRRGHAKSQSVPLPTPTPLYGGTPSLTGETEGTVEYGPAHTSSCGQSIGTQHTRRPARPLQVETTTDDSAVQTASQYAQSYLVDLPDSPFAPSKQNFRSLELELEDTRCHIDETALTFQGTPHELDVGRETQSAECSLAAPDVPVPSSHEGRASHRPLPQTYDSGYSSSSSYRTIDRKGHGEALSDRPVQPSNSRSECAERHGKTMRRSILSTSSMYSADLEQLDGFQIYHRPEPLMLDTSARSSASDATLSPHTPRSFTSFDSTSSRSAKRLQRRCPSQAEVPVVQSCQPIPEGTIPDVPDHVRARFMRRLSNTPGMECLTNTYENKDDVLAGRPTASSLADTAQWPSQHVEQASTAARQTVRPAAAEIHQLTEIEPVRPPTPPVHSHRKSRSLFRKKSNAAEKESENAALSIIDLGDAAASLGTSPYDIAMTGPRRESLTSPTHPHQIGVGLSRAKSTVRMDSEAAAEFARMRSKDRMVVEPAMPQQPQRRKSYHSAIDVGEAKASKRRPSSVVGDLPPVPSIDRSKHSGQQKTMISTRDNRGQKKLESNMSSNAEVHGRRHAVTQSLGETVYRNQNMPQQAVNWDAHADAWRQRRKSIGEGLRTQYGLVDGRILPQTTSDGVENWGRFSGGLGYGYEGQGVGVGGSAGTRQLNSYASSKSMKWRVQHGVDLSDVPIMLRECR